MLFPDAGLSSSDPERLMICFLTVNRTVGYVRVLYQPIGDFFPVVIAPPNSILLTNLIYQ